MREFRRHIIDFRLEPVVTPLSLQLCRSLFPSSALRDSSGTQLTGPARLAGQVGECDTLLPLVELILVARARSLTWLQTIPLGLHSELLVYAEVGQFCRCVNDLLIQFRLSILS